MDCLTKDAEEQIDRFEEHVRIGIVYFDSFPRLYTYTCTFIHSILSMSHFLRSSSARASSRCSFALQEQRSRSSFEEEVSDFPIFIKSAASKN